MEKDELIERGIAATVRHAEEAAARRSPPRVTEDVPGRRLIVTRGSEVKLKPLVWWEPGLILCAAINLLAAREGRGKTTIAAGWAARETRSSGTVLWIGTEESREHIIAPRLVAADAVMDRVLFVDVQTDLGTGALVFPLDLRAIEKTVREHGVTMLVIDPAKGVMASGISGNDDIAIRQYLEPIAAMAARCDVVVLGLAHFGKREGADSGKLILGSIAWSQVARSVLSVAEDPDTGNRIITNTKANLTADDRSIECRFVSKTLETDDGPTVIGRVEFIGETDKDARDFLAGDDSDDRTAAEHWLEDSLKAGGVKAKELLTAAANDGISRSALYRAKKKLAVIDRTEGFPRTSTWYWPSHPKSQADETTGTTGTTGDEQEEQGGLGGTTEDHTLHSSQSSHRPTSGTNGETTVRHLSAVPPTSPVGGLTENTPGQTDRVARALAKAAACPRCTVCDKPVVAGQGDTHFSCSEGETA